jgi:hypothetical protein
VYTGYWFGANENDRAVYFKDKTRIELVTLAFIIVAVSIFSSAQFSALIIVRKGPMRHPGVVHRALEKPQVFAFSIFHDI